MLDDLFEFDLSIDDDSDPVAFQRSRRLICSASADGQVAIHRFGSIGIVMTAEEARTAYRFLGDSATIWGRALKDQA